MCVCVSMQETIIRRRMQSAPSSKDWRQEGKVSIMKNQGQCGGCWAFAASGSIESSYLIATGRTAQQTQIDLSDQQLLSCSGAGSCNGGGCPGAIDYVARAYLTTTRNIPYRAFDGEYTHTHSLSLLLQ